MKDILNKIIAFVGVDRFAHFGLSGFFCALAAIFSGEAFLFVAFAVTLAGIVKEVRFDEHPDWWDFVAAEIGVVLAMVAMLVKIFCF